jgi:hypothetical protein
VAAATALPGAAAAAAAGAAGAGPAADALPGPLPNPPPRNPANAPLTPATTSSSATMRPALHMRGPSTAGGSPAPTSSRMRELPRSTCAVSTQRQCTRFMSVSARGAMCRTEAPRGMRGRVLPWRATQAASLAAL